MLNSDGKLQELVAYLGGANDILLLSADVTKSIDACIDLETNTDCNEYQFSLMYAKPDKLVFREEKYRCSAERIDGKSNWASSGVGDEEAKLPETANGSVKLILNLLRKLIVYPFYSTSDTVPM